MKLFPKSDLKSYLLFSSRSFLRALRLSPRQFFLPSLIIYPSNICNFRCIMCDEGADSVKAVKRMDFETMEKLIQECSSFTIGPKIHFSGLGEPLVYPEIAKLMRLFKDRKVHWSMTTNGYLLEKYAEDLVENDCRAVNISIHGIGPDHDRVTRISNAFDKAITGLQKLDSARRDKNSSLPLIALNCVITNQNVSALRSILDRLLSLPVNSLTFQHLIFSREDFLNKEPFIIHEDEKIDLLKQFISYVNANKFSKKINFFPKIKAGDLRDYYSVTRGKFNHSCILPWLSVRIYPDGDVGMCDVVFGNIRKATLKSIINNDEAIAFRRRLIDNEFRSPACFRCCHRHYY